MIRAKSKLCNLWFYAFVIARDKDSSDCLIIEYEFSSQIACVPGCAENR